MPILAARKAELAIARSKGIEGLGFAYRQDGTGRLDRFDLGKYFTSPVPPEKEVINSLVTPPTIWPEFGVSMPNISQVINYDAMGMQSIPPPSGQLERLIQANPWATLAIAGVVIWQMTK